MRILQKGNATRVTISQRKFSADRAREGMLHIHKLKSPPGSAPILRLLTKLFVEICSTFVLTSHA